MWVFLVAALGLSLLINASMFVVAYRRGTDKLTDASYAVSFIVLVLFAFVTGQPSTFRIVLCGMVIVWAARLGSFLLYRIRKTGKDSRFDDIRGNVWRFGKFWLGQALAVWVILIPVLLALRHDKSNIGLAVYTGLGIWLVGMLLETIADMQKFRFSSNPANKGKWISGGLWSWSRHPNYFGEMLVWIGVYFFARGVLSPPEAIFGLASPLFIISLLLFVSGVPIL